MYVTFFLYTTITTPYIYTKFIYSICILQSLLHIYIQSIYIYARMCVWSRPLLNIYTQITHVPYIYCRHYSIYIHKLYIFHIYTAITTVYIYTRYIYICTISRLLIIIGLFCRIWSLLQGSFAKETYNFKEPVCGVDLRVYILSSACSIYMEHV